MANHCKAGMCNCISWVSWCWRLVKNPLLEALPCETCNSTVHSFATKAIAPILSLGGQRVAVFGLARGLIGRGKSSEGFEGFSCRQKLQARVWNPTGTLAAPASASGEGAEPENNMRDRSCASLRQD